MGGSLRSYSRATLDGGKDNRGLTYMGTSANAGSGMVLVRRSGGGWVGYSPRRWGWVGYVPRCPCCWRSPPDLVGCDRRWPSCSI